jgi:cytochrome oxidase assembly protein ShyY1
MQIDGFTAVHEWQGMALRFTDPDKNVRYEIQSEARPKATGASNARPTTQFKVPPDTSNSAPTPAGTPTPATSSPAAER